MQIAEKLQSNPPKSKKKATASESIEDSHSYHEECKEGNPTKPNKEDSVKEKFWKDTMDEASEKFRPYVEKGTKPGSFRCIVCDRNYTTVGVKIVRTHCLQTKKSLKFNR